MAHRSETSEKLTVQQIVLTHSRDLSSHAKGFNDVCMLVLPIPAPHEENGRLDDIAQLIGEAANELGPEATLITIGESLDLVSVHEHLSRSLTYQSWIAIKRTTPLTGNSSSLPHHHFGALVHSRYKGTLRHTKTRIAYSYCPACDKTTKDYGGKKHTYHEYGTLASDVWRDISCDPEHDLSIVIERFADLFGIEQYKTLRVLDCRSLGLKTSPVQSLTHSEAKSTTNNSLPETFTNIVLEGDCVTELSKLPDNSVDFAFADPPYNLGKKYSGYSDDLAANDYFKWCDTWIGQLARVLKPGRTCAVLNIPLYAIRHFSYLETVLEFQSWIVWDALSYPVRLLMPSHYAILCFSKGKPRSLPRLEPDAGQENDLGVETLPLAEGYCLRASCVEKRKVSKLNDRGPLTDLWWDIHRLKHNTRRVDHPCQLPPSLMYRLINLFTLPNEVVLDPFNGAGTTSLAAEQLNRRYLGIERDQTYHRLTLDRHEELRRGVNPFGKAERALSAKNSPVRRVVKQKYAVPKKTLQLEVRRVAQELNRLPSREELAMHGKYPIQYYDDYFVSWGEVCAAARTTGMTEDRVSDESAHLQISFADVAGKS